jgi:hypothetical protein
VDNVATVFNATYSNFSGFASVPLGIGICNRFEIVGASWVIVVF